MLSEDPRVDVSGAACTKWDDEFNGTGWEVLCCNRQSQQNWQYECCQTQKRAHKSSTLVCSGFITSYSFDYSSAAAMSHLPT
jgi:hypothetical protein